MAHTVRSPQLPFPPGPKGNFFLGSARELARSWPGHSERCARDYGDVVCYRFLHVPICQLTHPDYIEYVLVKHAANFHKSRDYAAFKFFLGNGLLTNEGPSWRAQRQLVQPAFRHENIAVYAEIMADSAAAHLSRWKVGEKRDLHQEMGELALDIVAKSLFGANVGHAAETIGETFRGSSARTVISRKSQGKERKRSVPAMTIFSTFPPMKPAVPPMRAASRLESNAAAGARSRDTRVP